MAESQGDNPWRRTLRFGMKGRDVALLQERLSRLGYYTGEIDGVFGILTKDAVRDLQKAHRLRVDGIAGKEVFAVIRSGLAKPVLRHFVARGETCAHIARRYNIPIELLLQANRLPDPEVHEGQCLDIPVSRLLAYCAGGDDAERSWDSYERHLAFISMVAPRWFTLHADGTITGEPVKRVTALASLADIRVVPVVAFGSRPFPPDRRNQASANASANANAVINANAPISSNSDSNSSSQANSRANANANANGSARVSASANPNPNPNPNANLEADSERERRRERERDRTCVSDEAGEATLDAVLMDAAARRAAIRGIAGAAARSRAHGIVLSVSAPGPGDGYAFTSFMRELASVLERDGRDLSLEIPAPGAEGEGAGRSPLEYQELARIARQIIVRLHEEPERLAVPAPLASPARARAVLKGMVRLVPPWKMVLGVPLFGIDFSAAPGAPPMRRAHSEIADILDIYKPSVVRAEPGGACMFRYRSFRVNHTVFFMDAASVASCVDLVLKFNLAGLAIADLGDEDPLIWDTFRTRFKALRDSVLPA
ncbi:MAG: hypothetical protein PWR07_830 [Bacillota bacterium]|nr:hypothetical protein [Bacillota bacterium]